MEPSHSSEYKERDALKFEKTHHAHRQQLRNRKLGVVDQGSQDSPF